MRASVKEEMGTIETAAETNGLGHNSTIHWGPCGCLHYIGQRMIWRSQKSPEIEVAVVMMAFFLYGMSHYANLIRLQIHVGCSKMGGQIRNVLTGCNRETTIQVSFSHWIICVRANNSHIVQHKHSTSTVWCIDVYDVLSGWHHTNS